MDKIKVEEGRWLDEGMCNWCAVELNHDGMPIIDRTDKVKLVYFGNFCLRFCAAHYREMLAAWVRLFIDEFLSEG